MQTAEKARKLKIECRNAASVHALICFLHKSSLWILIVVTTAACSVLQAGYLLLDNVPPPAVDPHWLFFNLRCHAAESSTGRGLRESSWTEFLGFTANQIVQALPAHCKHSVDPSFIILCDGSILHSCSLLLFSLVVLASQSRRLQVLCFCFKLHCASARPSRSSSAPPLPRSCLSLYLSDFGFQQKYCHF